MAETIDARKLPIETRARFAAYLRAVHNMSQTEIGTVLGGLSQPHVSRLLRRAEKSGILVVEHRFREEELTDGERGALKRLLAPSALAAALQAFCARHDLPVPGLAVYDSGPGVTEVAMAQRRRRFGRMAAGRVVELLAGQKIVGVAWGRTIHALADHIAASHPPRDQAGIEFVPVCAELLLTSQSGHSSSRLAEKLARIYRRTDGETLQLTGFPAYVPRGYDQAAQNAIWQLIRDTPNYERIFTGPESMVAHMDALITSVGRVDALVRGGFDDFLRAGQIDRRMLPDLVVGDMGGVLIPRHDLPEPKRRLVRDLNRMWTGISPTQIASIAERAAASPDMTGVVVTALRAERAGTILELVRLKLANELIIDRDAADELKRLLAREG